VVLCPRRATVFTITKDGTPLSLTNKPSLCPGTEYKVHVRDISMAGAQRMHPSSRSGALFFPPCKQLSQQLSTGMFFCSDVP
jgi:hypothetical protein